MQSSCFCCLGAAANWLPLPPTCTPLQGKKRKDTVCIVLADDTVEEAKIRMNKVGAGCRAVLDACARGLAAIHCAAAG